MAFAQVDTTNLDVFVHPPQRQPLILQSEIADALLLDLLSREETKCCTQNIRAYLTHTKETRTCKAIVHTHVHDRHAQIN